MIPDTYRWHLKWVKPCEEQSLTLRVVGVRIVLNCRTSIWCHRTAWCGHTHLRGIRGRTLTYPFPSLSLLSLSPLISWLFREYLSNPVAGLFHQLLLLSRELFLGILMAHSLTLSRCHLGCHLIRKLPWRPLPPSYHSLSPYSEYFCLCHS